MKRVIIIHGWDGCPKNCWFPWLKKELEKRGWGVLIPEMPDSSYPRIEPWVKKLKEVVENPDKDTYLIGHSIGCQTIMRYLQTLSGTSKIGGVVFVAGWVSLTPMSIREPEEQVIVKPWFETPLNFNKIKKIGNKFVAIFSDDDPYVPIEKNSDTYKNKLNAEIIIEHNKGHFSDDAGVKELPIVLKKLLEMSK